MTDNKAKEAAVEKREASLTSQPIHEARSIAESDELYYVTPQATGRNKEEAVQTTGQPKTLEQPRVEWEPPQEPIRSQSLVDADVEMRDRAGEATARSQTGQGKAPPMSHESLVDTDVEMRNRTEEATYRTQVARQEAPPLASKTPIDDEAVLVEKNMTFRDEEQPPVPARRPTTEDHEMLAVQLQAEEDGTAAGWSQPEEEDVVPILPSRHISFVPSFDMETQDFTLSWRRPLTDYPSLTITPDAESDSYWRLNYQTKYFARLHRYQSTQARVDGDFPARQVAEMKFPDFIWPGCGPTIKLEPYDEAAGPRRADIFMKCTGWLTTRYAVDVPVLGGARCTWRTLRSVNKGTTNGQGGEDVAPSSHADPDVDGRLTLSFNSTTTDEAKQLLTVGDLIAQAKNLINNDAWTPYPPHYLIMGPSANSERIIATYSRLAPWNRNAGTLSINSDHSTSPEYIEGIIIACAAMVGMQDRMGLASSLMEASTESVMAKRREGNGAGLTSGGIRPYVRGLQKSSTAPVERKEEEKEMPQRSGSVRKGLERLSMQARELVPKSAGAGRVVEGHRKADEKTDVDVAA
ncbi:hypothetical protein DOTSEDRAFT_69264 [Dothistroma septosporum NZE10]|uniref:Uncharacterized protein n=1 Tax=Dothistroma septosporum (strain NZE10 / CBS 128990) TaxID=675120 RepID=N1PYG0_DOTSN|nr:hypothetical protein DOTSEDRAFT_69264 [Dothistroma septosporum NZE10]